MVVIKDGRGGRKLRVNNEALLRIHPLLKLRMARKLGRIYKGGDKKKI